VESVREKIIKRKIATEAELLEIDNRVAQQVDECVRFAEESSYPDPSEAYKDVYAQDDYPYLSE
jgi:pyruvate dehydrogenase E1 component alpha subunit